MDPVASLVDVFRFVEKNYTNPTLLNDFEKGRWESTSVDSFLTQIRHLTLGLQAIGLKRGERVGILTVPSSRWTIAEFAILFAGGVLVPLFANISEENFVFECTQAEVKHIFVGGEAQWEMYDRNQQLFSHAIDIDDAKSSQKIVPFAEVMAKGEELAKKEPGRFDELLKRIDPNETAAIVYTSGSTGVPKGVELSHQNICAQIHDCKDNWTSNERYLSILPLAHIYGQIINLFAVYWGTSTYYCNDYKNLGEACRQVRPTVLVIVPRVAEKLYARFLLGVQEGSWFKKIIGTWALRRAKVQKILPKNSLSSKIADKLVYQKLRNALGGELRLAVSGGAAISPDLQYFFENIGIPILQGWGLTEACPCAVNSYNSNKFGTVGIPYSNLQVVIAANGEVLVKGPAVMKGYYKNPEATAGAIDKEGWLHTGDKGKIDEEGYLTIIGRLKELYKTSTGEYVAPVPIEQVLTSHPLIEMAMVVAEGRKFVSALFFPNKEQVALFKKQYGQTNLSDEEFLNSWAIRKEIEKHLNRINEHLNHWEQVRDYRFIQEPLTVESGDLTPSMKIRREAVSKKFAPAIEDIYQHMEMS